MNIINSNVKDETIINKSRFIALIIKADNEKDALNIIKELKKEYKAATHYCYAYIIGNIKRMSDDGEPNHTAGMPILNVLENNDLNNVIAVVIRYFGGIKLGAGGLVRAYTNSVVNALEKTEIIPLKKEVKVKIEFDYANVNNVNYILKDYKITYKKFDENIIYEFIYEDGNYPKGIDKYALKKSMVV